MTRRSSPLSVFRKGFLFEAMVLNENIRFVLNIFCYESWKQLFPVSLCQSRGTTVRYSCGLQYGFFSFQITKDYNQWFHCLKRWKCLYNTVKGQCYQVNQVKCSSEHLSPPLPGHTLSAVPDKFSTLTVWLEKKRPF